LNTGRSVGVKLGTATLDAKLRRSSSYDSFYKEAAGRKNLDVLYGAPVTSINTEAVSNSSYDEAQARATGVNFVDQSTSLVHQVKAKKEVILSLGAFHSPQMLMLSVKTNFLNFENTMLISSRVWDQQRN
jgi:choline dehydrogenase